MYKVPKSITDAINDVDAAKTRVMNLVQDEMAKVAKRKKMGFMAIWTSVDGWAN